MKQVWLLIDIWSSNCEKINNHAYKSMEREEIDNSRNEYESYFGDIRYCL